MSDIIIIDTAERDFRKSSHKTECDASIPGRYALTRQVDVNGNRREFSCRVVKISKDALTLVAPMKGIVSERVIVTLMEFGKLEGSILKLRPDGFVMSVNLTDAERRKFAAKIDWYDQHKNRGFPDKRRAKRIVPSHPHSIVLLADGSVVGAFVLDMSVSGVAVSAAIEPRIGEPLAVGKIIGRVVRHFDGGFGVAFIDHQDPESLERMLLVPPAS